MLCKKKMKTIFKLLAHMIKLSINANKQLLRNASALFTQLDKLSQTVLVYLHTATNAKNAAKTLEEYC
jgi:hypothetical protein